MHDPRHILEPIEVETTPGQFRVIRTVAGLGEVLVAPAWPKPNGPKYQAALRACVLCLEGRVTASDTAREAFLEAAKDAGVLIRELR
jgi:hypothetical protein